MKWRPQISGVQACFSALLIAIHHIMSLLTKSGSQGELDKREMNTEPQLGLLD